MSLCNEDSFLEFEGNYEEPKIISDDDDEDEGEESEEGVNMKYCLEDVDTGELLDYVDEIKGETKAANREIEELRSEIKELKSIIKEQAAKISSLETKLGKGRTVDKAVTSQILSLQQSFGRFFRIDVSKEGPGILSQLKEQQKTPFDRLFIASQSSNDLHNLLVPHIDSDFCTTRSNFFIEFELETAVMISGVKVFSYKMEFPKSFDISVDGRTVISVTEAKELNGKHKKMKVSFAPVQGRKVRFTQTGPNWDKNTIFLHIKGIEILSTEPRYSKGVFATLVNESENDDPHKCPVIISATNFDFNSFHSLNSSCNICTYPNENSWFQVELTQGAAILNGFRLKRCGDKLKNYKLICTDDSSKPESSWTTLIEIDEKTENEHEVLDIYEFPQPSPPTRFVRLVQTGQNWNNELFLQFYHFDLFGTYF